MMKKSVFAARLDSLRCFTTKQKKELPEDLVSFTLGRARHERKDSITPQILIQRKQHLQRIEALGTPEKSFVNTLESQGFGSKKRLYGSYNLSRQLFVPFAEGEEEAQVVDPSAAAAMSLVDKKSLMGAGGHAVHVGSASKNWPTFKHLLPEIAFAGHSNSGKSTLVNALTGVLPRHGLARVSDRAGWTDQICFYQLGKKPPLLTLVDLPGYGHSVATQQDQVAWTSMIRDYLKSRKVLTRCCVLVDSTRGLCSGDKHLLRFMEKEGIPWTVVLTKSDILSAEQLANSIRVVSEDLDKIFKPRSQCPSPKDKEESDSQTESVDEEEEAKNFTFRPDWVLPVSSSTGAGVNGLWKFLRQCTEKDSTPFINAKSVREHVKANEERNRPKIEAHRVIPAQAAKLSNRVRRRI